MRDAIFHYARLREDKSAAMWVRYRGHICMMYELHRRYKLFRALMELNEATI